MSEAHFMKSLIPHHLYSGSKETGLWGRLCNAGTIGRWHSLGAEISRKETDPEGNASISLMYIATMKDSRRQKHSKNCSNGTHFLSEE